MSEKKSPPHKEKPQVTKPLVSETKSNKRKLATPASPTSEDEKKNQQKRKRQSHHGGNMMADSSPEHVGLGSPRGAGGATMSRLSVPYSERQQMALLMRMQDESTIGDASPKSPSTGNQVSSTKRTPLDKKVNKRNERGEAPLHMAARKGDYKQTKRLLKAGASVNMKDYAGWTALHEACNSGNLRVARYLLKAGACVNVQGFENDTPLHDASSNGHRKLVQLLLRNGADPYQANQQGKSAVEVAATAEIEAILRNNGHGLSRDSDLDDSAESSSDSNLSSTKDEERHTADEDNKTQSGVGKLDGHPLSQTSSTFITSGSSAVPSRRPSVPPSPDKMASSPRLFLKLQSSKKSSASDEQQKGVLEWNVLPMDQGSSSSETALPPSSTEASGSSAVTSIAASIVISGVSNNSHSVQPSLSSSSSTTNSSSSSKREENATWARVRGQSPSTAAPATGVEASSLPGNCPDSTVSLAQPMHASPFPMYRTKTEPFTPHASEFPSPLLTSSGSSKTNVDATDDVFASKPLTGSSSSVYITASSSSSSNGKQQQQHHHNHPPTAPQHMQGGPAAQQKTISSSPFCSSLPGVHSTPGSTLPNNNKQLPVTLPLLSSTSSSVPLSSSSLSQQPLTSPHPSQQNHQHMSHLHHHSMISRPSQQHYHNTQQQHKHSSSSIPPTLGTYHGGRPGAHTTFSGSQQSVVSSSSLTPSSILSISTVSSLPPPSSSSISASLTSGPSLALMPSSLPSSSQQRTSGGPPVQSLSSSSTTSSSCQFSMVSSSSVQSSSILGQQQAVVHTNNKTSIAAPSSTTTQLSGPVGRMAGPPKGGGGSIVTGLSDRAVAASSSSSSSSSTTAGGGGSLVWDRTSQLVHPFAAAMEDRSDTSSCDSPLRMDIVDDPSAATSGGTGSRPSTPKVPPLKIIMPPKQGVPGSGGPANTSGGVSSSKGNKQTTSKPALPYVLNPVASSTQGGEGGEAESAPVQGEGGDLNSMTATGIDGVATTSGSDIFPAGVSTSRPSSRAGSGVGGAVSSSSKLLDGVVGDDRPNNLDLDDGASRDEGSDGRDNTDSSSGKNEDGKRPTRTLRSHTAMLQQTQAKHDPKDKSQDKEKNGGGSLIQGEEGDNSSTTRSQRGDDSAADDSNVPHRKRKLRTKAEAQAVQTSGTVTTSKLGGGGGSQPQEKPPNPYETYLNLRRQIALRHRTLYNVAPKAPSNFKDYLMVNCTYVLQGNATSTLAVPVLPPPNFVPDPMKEFFNQQEKERYRLRLQHVIEREKLMLSIEQEILREHGRAARAMANQRLPFSVCTILREEEIYNLQELEQVEDREKNVRSRYNGRQFLSWLQAVDDKYEKIKQLLLMRHHHEAESLCAVQKLDWEWKLKEFGLCDHKITPTIDDLHVPMVSVSNEFDLLPSS